MTYEQWQAETQQIVRAYVQYQGGPPSYADVAHILYRRAFEQDRFPTLAHALAEWGYPVPPDPPLPPIPPIPPVKPWGIFALDEHLMIRRDGVDRVFPWHGLSEFRLLYDAIHDRDAAARRMDRAARYGRNGLRVLGMAHNMFRLSPADSGYQPALEWMIREGAARNLAVEFCVFADAQDVMPDYEQRMGWLRTLVSMAESWPTVIWQLANEPFKNGWESATDPALLELATEFRDGAPARPFSIGDPLDVVPLGPPTDILAARSPVLVIHGERKMTDSRWAGWVDHLKGWSEIPSDPRVRIHDEPMGYAPTSIDGKRDSRPEAHAAAAMVCAMLGYGFTLHYFEGDHAGIENVLAACEHAHVIPQGPDCHFSNGGTGGAPVRTWTGYDKVRCMVRDNGEAWAVAYGHQHGVLEWRGDGDPEQVWRGENVALWRTT